MFVPELNKLFLASGDDGMLRVFRGDTLELLDSIHLEPGPNRVVFEPKSKLVYVGYGGKDAGKDYGEVGVIDARQDKHVGDIKVVAHPSELLLDKSGTTLFVFSSAANRVHVIDTSKRQVGSTWPITSDHPGDAAFDEATSRLFIGTHTPPEMIVMDTKSGREVAHLPTAEGMDGVYFDAGRKRVYVSGGRDLPVGSAYVYQSIALPAIVLPYSPFSTWVLPCGAPYNRGETRINLAGSGQSTRWILHLHWRYSRWGWRLAAS